MGTLGAHGVPRDGDNRDPSSLEMGVTGVCSFTGIEALRQWRSPVIPGVQGHRSPQFPRDRGLWDIRDVPKDRSGGDVLRDKDMGTLRALLSPGRGCGTLGVLSCHWGYF